MSVDGARRRHNWRFIAKAEGGQSLFGVDAAVLYVAFALEYTFCVLSVFLRVTCAIGGVTRGACVEVRSGSSRLLYLILHSRSP